jgi:hypothetical protein
MGREAQQALGCSTTVRNRKGKVNLEASMAEERSSRAKILFLEEEFFFAFFLSSAG